MTARFARIVARKGARPGGRSARVVATVLRSTLEVLGRTGYARLRIEDVAAAAGVNKTTIYRRWPTRADLVVEAVARLSPPPSAIDTGRLAPDLTATLLSATSLWATPGGRGIGRVLIAEGGDPDVEHVVAMMRERHRAPVRELLERARRRGDLPRGRNVELLLDVLIGAIYNRLRESARPLDRAWVRSVVRLVLAGVA
jgi:AcrR family transcriptional regulator